jgi:hypothetical protein
MKQQDFIAAAVLLCSSMATDAFPLRLPAPTSNQRHQQQHCLYQSFNDDNNSNSNNDWKPETNFNPFNYQGSSTQSTSGSSSTRPISLRKAQLQKVYNQLLDAAASKTNNEDYYETILLDNQDVFLEPLEDVDAVLDPDSVIQPNMNRSERYKVYLESLRERMEVAKIPKVKTVLKAIYDFVQKNE